MIAAASTPANRSTNAASGRGAGITVSTSLREASGAPAMAAQAVSEETPGTTSTG